MRSFNDIVKVLKSYLSSTTNAKVLDKDVADALDISVANFATLKRRNSMPYANILHFCQREKICCSELFFEKE